MTKKLLYQGQILDPSGYAVAGRGYVKSIVEYIKDTNADIDFKVIAIRADQQSAITAEEKELLDNHQFESEEAYKEWVSDGDYHYAFHHPPTYAIKIPSTRELSSNSLSTTCLTVWETDSIPVVWEDIMEYLDVDKVVVPCAWNKMAFEQFSDRPVTEVPHLINDSFIEKDNLQEIPDLVTDDVFTILTVGQWTDRKALDNVVKAFFMEFKEQEDCALIVKTYGNIQDARPEYQEAQSAHILGKIKSIRNAMLPESLERPPKCKLHFLYGLYPKAQMNYLYKKCDLFALLSKAEGFGLPIAEAIAHETPVLVHDKGGHTGFVDPESNFVVECYETPAYCTVFPLVYTCDSNWYETNFLSARQKLREAYDAWKNTAQESDLKDRGVSAKKYMFEITADPVSIGKNLVEAILQETDGAAGD